MGDINVVCDHYAEYVDRLNSLTGKEKKAENEAKFAERIIKSNKKEGLIDRLMHSMKG